MSSPAPGRPLTLITLGSAALVRGPGEAGAEPVVVFTPGKPLALLVYLACAPGRTATRDHLTDLLWSDNGSDGARHAFRQTLWYLRQRIGDGWIESDGAALRLLPGLATDRDAFLAAIEAGDLDAAIAAYAGDFLASFAVPGGTQFDQWADAERHRLRSAFARCAEVVARRRLATAHVRDAVVIARRVRDTDPLAESGWRLLLETLVAAEDPVNAAAEAAHLEHILAQEGRDPEPATRAALRVARHASPAHGSETQPATLATEMIGREREFAIVLAAWEAARTGAARHVHLSAHAGVGKTRLLASVQARLRAGRGRVVLVRAHQGGRIIPYALAGDVAAALARLPGARGISPAAAQALVAIDPSLSSLYDVAPDAARDDEALRRRTVALHELVTTLVEDAPLALLLDDVHWADDASRIMLQHLLERLGAEHVLVMTAARPMPGHQVGTRETTPLTLGPLGLDDVAALLASIAAFPDCEWATRLPAQLLEATAGVPLAIIELLHLLLERDLVCIRDGRWTAGDVEAIGRTLGAGSALRARVGALPAAAGQLLLALSAAGIPLADASLLAACPHAGEADLAELEQRGFVSRSPGGVEAAHDEVARTAIAAADAPALADAHRRLAEVIIAGRPGDADAVRRAAGHLVAAGDERALARLFIQWFATLPAARRRDRVACARDLLGAAATDDRLRRLAGAVPLRRRPQAWLGVAIGAGSLALALGTATVALSSWRGAQAPPDAELFVASGDGGIHYTRLPLDEALLQRASVLDARERLEPDPAWARGVGVIAAPDGGTLAYFRVDRPEGLDLYVAPFDGAERRVTTNPHDDVPWSWSPDGRYVAFHSGRWSPRTFAQLGVVNARTGALRRLSASGGSDSYPQWSRDGTRIAFMRRAMEEARPDQLCWVTVNGARERCLRPAGLLTVAPVTFLGTDHVLAVGDTGSGAMLVNVDLHDGATIVVDRRTGTRLASPDGRWIACLCSDDDGVARLIVHPADHPERARPVTIRGAPAAGLTLLWRTTRPVPFVDRLAIEGPATMAVGATARFRVAARDASGSPTDVPPEVVLWSSDDTSIVAVDSAGVAHARREGAARLRASAGGWREALGTVLVTRKSARLLLRDDWSNAPGTHFVPWGDPKPEVVRAADGTPALLVNGDDSFSSGVYSRALLDGTAGLGVRARMWFPVHRPAWQALSVALDGGIDERALARWDHRTGLYSAVRAASCNVGYPNGEGMAGLRAFRSTAGTVEAPAGIRDGRWVTVDLQLLPDGRCAVAIDGVPRAVSRSPVPLDRPFRLVLSGQSVATRMLVGPLELWEGVRGDVDWSLLDAAPPARASR
ncbi:MAG TPA: AAA family ATPase [Gemmatimonadaceae bacterium]